MSETTTPHPLRGSDIKVGDLLRLRLYGYTRGVAPASLEAERKRWSQALQVVKVARSWATMDDGSKVRLDDGPTDSFKGQFALVYVCREEHFGIHLWADINRRAVADAVAKVDPWRLAAVAALLGLPGPTAGGVLSARAVGRPQGAP